MSFNPVILTDTLCGQWESFLIHFWILLTWLCESLMASLLWQGSISWVPDGAMPLAQHSREKNALCKVTFKRLSSFSFNLPFCFPGAHTWARLLCLGPRGTNEAWAGTLNQGRQWGLTVVSCHLPTFSLSGQFLVNRRPCSDSALTTTSLPPPSPLGRLIMVFCGIVLHFPPFDLVPHFSKHSCLLQLIQLSYTEINSKVFAFFLSCPTLKPVPIHTPYYPRGKPKLCSVTIFTKFVVL